MAKAVPLRPPLATLVQTWLMEVAGDGKDRAVDILRDLDSRLDNAVSGAQGRIMGVFSGPGDPAASQEAVDLVTEAIDLVAQVLAARPCAHTTLWPRKCLGRPTGCLIWHATCCHPAVLLG